MCHLIKCSQWPHTYGCPRSKSPLCPVNTGHRSFRFWSSWMERTCCYFTVLPNKRMRENEKYWIIDLQMLQVSNLHNVVKKEGKIYFALQSAIYRLFTLIEAGSALRSSWQICKIWNQYIVGGGGKRGTDSRIALSFCFASILTIICHLHLWRWTSKETSLGDKSRDCHQEGNRHSSP